MPVEMNHEWLVVVCSRRWSRRKREDNHVERNSREPVSKDLRPRVMSKKKKCTCLTILPTYM